MTPMPTHKQLTGLEIHEHLQLYPEEYRFVAEAIYDDGTLYASLVPFRYPFTIHDLGYVTATQISLYLSQVTYILIAEAIRDLSSEVHSLLEHKLFNDRMHAGALFFLEVSQRMRRPINKDGPIPATITIDYTRRRAGNAFAFLSFELADGSCVGSLKLGMGQ